MNPHLMQKISEKKKKQMDNIIKLNEGENRTLISLLQKVQKQYGYLPSDILFYISKKLKIPPAEIYGIATFYTQFKLIPRGKYVITCCEGTACHIKESSSLLIFIENYLGIKSGENTKDGMFSLESVACLGCCAISPVIVINDQIYGHLTLKKISKILNILKKETKIQRIL